MKSLKRFMAVLVCACMLIPNIGITSFAQEDTEITEDISTDNTTEELDDASINEGKQENSEAYTGEMMEPVTEAVTEEVTEEASIDETEDVSVDALPLNYLVIENDYVATPSTQYVVASIGEEGTGISDAVLTYINQTSGVSYTKSADKVRDFLILFNLDFSDSSYMGQYKLVSISYTVNGVEYIINLDEQGVSAVFGVDKEVDITPTAWLVDEQDSTSTESSEDVPGVIVNDVTGEDVSASDVEEALLENGFSDVKLEAPKYCYDEDWNETRVAADPSSFIVVLDPGHGGGDSGATRVHNGVNYVERDLNLKIALACKAELEKSGVTVYLTRSDNSTYRGLTERTEIAAGYGADLFVSIHNNSQTADTATGSEVWVPNSSPYNYYAYTTGQTLGKDILNQLGSLGLTKRGVFTRYATDGDTYPTGDTSDYYTVINESRRRGIPGIIIEHAYVSNPSDAATYLGSDASLTALGQADARGILEYIKSADESYIYLGVDYSPVYDYDYYISHQPDVKAAYGNNKALALAHFVNCGMNEGRQAKADFNVYTYMNRYSDLKAAYGNDLKSYYIHYIYCGVKEKRSGAGSASTPSTSNTTSTNSSNSSANNVSAGLTVYNGVDYKDVYNYSYYINKYADIKAAYGSDQRATLEHFVLCGMNEGRQAKDDFNVAVYRSNYADLRAAFGNDLKSYYMHYILFGKNEGRNAKTSNGSSATSTTTTPTANTTTNTNTSNTTTSTSDSAGLTIYNGVDYSAVYNYNYYVNKYADIKAAYGNDQRAVLEHFVCCGMKEGRQGSANFDVWSYKNAYQDLRFAYGNDLKSYYMHYIYCGKNEGRNMTTGVTKLQNPLTTFNGIDYSLVYDYNYYISVYPDIKAAFGGDETQTLVHFITFGMKEGRQGNANFNVNYYKANYGDLALSFGNDLPSYYIHYINFGNKERRVANTVLANAVNTPIMGSANTTVSQMVAYYNSCATYPEFYAGSDAPTIEAFCQIYIEECQAEGVRADVAFCQAMKETGFLKYGGQVKIEQYNFAGLGATDGSANGEAFGSVREGVRAHVQHLKAYASKDALANPCVDLRFTLVTRGSAPYVEWLGIQENPYGKGWATAARYGYSLINDYMAKLKKY